MKFFASILPSRRFFEHGQSLLRQISLAAALLLATTVNAAIGEKEVVIPESQIQSAIDKHGPIERRYAGGLLTLNLNEPPRIHLGGTHAGRADLTARIIVTLFGNPPIPVDVNGTAGLRYDDKAKAFFLEDPVAESIQSSALPPEAQASARQAMTKLMNTYFRDKPVYTLRSDGNLQELTARWLLKAVRIESGILVATLSPF